MIRHALRLAWRRRGANALVAAEIAGSFLVLGLLATAAAQFAISWRRPLGFSPRDAWTVLVMLPSREGGGGVAPRDLMAAARTSPHVESAAATSTVPYDEGEDSWHFDHDGGLIDAEFATVGDELAPTMGLRIVQGRWFQDGDHALPYRPVVIDVDFARRLRPDGDAVGAELPRSNPDRPALRVIGVVADYRRKGELSASRPFMFLRGRDDEPAEAVRLLLRMRPGTTASAEPELLRALGQAAPGAQIGVRRLEDMRRSSLRGSLQPLAAGGLVAAFLLVMVALGLLGVLWQNVARRTSEFALRRALGATPGDIRALVLGELATVCAIALLLAGAVAVQVPVPTSVLEPGARWLGLLASALVVLALVMLCGLHPGRLAMRAEPAEALRQE